MVTPTHIQVTVLRARGLLTKGKHGTNDVYITIGFGKEKLQTTIKERASSNELTEWNEGFELQIPQGQKPELVITVCHRKTLGVSFLGLINFPTILNEYNPSNTPKNTWYTLRGKLGEDDGESRGEIELKIWILRKNELINSMSMSAINNGKIGINGNGTGTGGGKNWSHAIAVGNAKSIWKKKANITSKGVPMHTLVPTPQRVVSVRNNFRSNSDPGVNSESDESDELEELRDLENTNTNTTIRKPSLTSTISQKSRNSRIDEEVETEFEEMPVRIPTRITRHNSQTSDEVRKAITPTNSSISSSNRSSQSNLRSNSYESSETISITSNARSSIKKKEAIPKPRIIPDHSKAISVDILMNGDANNNTSDGSLNYNHNLSSIKDINKISTPGFFGQMFTRQTRQAPIGVSNPIQSIGPLNDLDSYDSVPDDILRRFDGKSKEELIGMMMRLQSNFEIKNKRVDDLENYIANLILRILETGQPELLQKKDDFSSRFRCGKYSL